MKMTAILFWCNDPLIGLNCYRYVQYGARSNYDLLKIHVITEPNLFCTILYLEDFRRPSVYAIWIIPLLEGLIWHRRFWKISLPWLTKLNWKQTFRKVLQKAILKKIFLSTHFAQTDHLWRLLYSEDFKSSSVLEKNIYWLYFN